MGTPDFAQESLKSLVENNYKVIGVVTNPDKPKGRGMKLVASPVKEYALEKNIPVYQPIKVRNNKEFIDKIKTLNPDVICVVAYGKILPKEILEIPKYGCINVHASLLPKYRGAAPIQWAVLNGDKETGVTTMYMDVGMDTGDMILKEKVEIGEDETTGELWDRLSKIGGELLVETLKQIENGTAPREKQSNNFTMAPMLNKEMSKIDWKNKTAQEIKNLVRGLNPIMGAYTFLKDKKIKFWKVDVSNKKLDEIEDVDNLENGTILLADQKEGLFIKTKEGVLKVIEIQGENAKRMSIGDFLRGNSIENLEKFE
jgi:methionyl-tRNA formyltransferase